MLPLPVGEAVLGVWTPVKPLPKPATVRLPNLPINDSNKCYANATLMALLAYPNPELKFSTDSTLQGFHRNLWTEGANQTFSARPTVKTFVQARVQARGKGYTVDSQQDASDFLMYVLNDLLKYERDLVTCRFLDTDNTCTLQKTSGIVNMLNDGIKPFHPNHASIESIARKDGTTPDMYTTEVMSSLSPWVMVTCTKDTEPPAPLFQQSKTDIVYLYAMLEKHGSENEHGSYSGHWTVAMRCPQQPSESQRGGPWYHFDDMSAVPVRLADSTETWMQSQEFKEHAKRTRVWMYQSDVQVNNNDQ